MSAWFECLSLQLFRIVWVPVTASACIYFISASYNVKIHSAFRGHGVSRNPRVRAVRCVFHFVRSHRSLRGFLLGYSKLFECLTPQLFRIVWVPVTATIQNCLSACHFIDVSSTKVAVLNKNKIFAIPFSAIYFDIFPL